MVGDREGEKGFSIDVESVEKDLVIGGRFNFWPEGGNSALEEMLIAKTQNFQTHYV